MSLGDEHGYGSDSGRSDRVGGSGQTRTRLPEGGGSDVYGGARRPVRTSRSLITVVGVVVLLIAAIAFANQGGGDTGSGNEAKRGGAAAPTSATGVRPVEGKNGMIPSGFAQDAQGAQSAAANFAVALVSAEILKPDRRQEIVGQIFVPTKVAELEAKFDMAYNQDFLDKVGLDKNGNAPAGMTYISRTAPMGTKVTGYAESAATVEVWCTGVFGTAGVGSTNPVANGWFTMTLEVQWTDGDWKVAGFSQKEGPAPVNADLAASGADEIAKAVDEYGGFTYAR